MTNPFFHWLRHSGISREIPQDVDEARFGLCTVLFNFFLCIACRGWRNLGTSLGFFTAAGLHGTSRESVRVVT